MPTDKSENHKTKSPEKLPPIEVKPQNSGEEHVRSKQPEYKERKPQNLRVINIGKIPKIDVIEGVDANRIARKANYISLASVLVNAFLLCATDWIAWVALKQYKSADSAAKIAEKTFLETKKHDSLSLAETKQEFELENRAYLEVTNFSKLRIYLKKITFEYQYTNISIQPAKMTREYLVVSVAPSDDPFYMDAFKMQIANAPETKNPIYITKEYNKQSPYNADINLTSDAIKGIKTGDKSIYFYGRVFYTNVMSKKKFIYDFIITMNGTDGSWSYLYEDNKPDN